MPLAHKARRREISGPVSRERIRAITRLRVAFERKSVTAAVWQTAQARRRHKTRLPQRLCESGSRRARQKAEARIFDAAHHEPAIEEAIELFARGFGNERTVVTG